MLCSKLVPRHSLTARIPLATAQVQRLISPERLVFGSAPLPRVAKRPRHAAPFWLADLIARLRQPGRALLPDAGPFAPPPPLLHQVNSQGRGPKDLASTNSQGLGPKYPVFCVVVSGLGSFGFR